ncbi:GNAT family N-acetyltransferase [Halobacillus halophilus]|uniref:GNAT family N-acetyltransferase n=1 Tax=Halobacillus halophilus TaxID=1570 RepID=UPI0013694A76|nr:GNAT family N-acetyltransferase [Halobacillus halophilus]
MDIQQVRNTQQLDDAYFVRKTVFVNEQQVPEELEIDEFDETSLHFTGYDNDEPVAAARLRFVQGYGKLERICVLKEKRGHSYGRQMIEKLEEAVRDHGYDKAKLNAQTQAEAFYEALGYVTISDTFMDAGIPHVTMVKELNN